MAALQRIRGKLFHSATSKPERILILILGLLFACSFFFVFDLFATVLASYGYLDGHFLDFYDYNHATTWDAMGGNMAYYPTIYAIFALWNLPLRLLFGVQTVTPDSTLVLYYNRLLCHLFLGLMLYMLYRLAKRVIRQNEQDGQSSVWVLVTIPFFFIASIAWGIYDSIYMTMMLAGLCLLLRGRKWDLLKSVLLFGVAVTIKSIVLFLAIPALFYKVKNIPKLAASCVGMLLPMLAEALLYLNSPTFRAYVLEPQDQFQRMLFGNLMSSGSLYLIAFTILCIVAYAKPFDEERPIKLVYLCFTSIALLFVLCTWLNQQWVFLFMPFLALLIAAQDYEKRKLMYLLNVPLSIALMGKVIGLWENFSEVCVGSSLLGAVLKAIPGWHAPETLFTRMIFTEARNPFCVSVYCAVLLYQIYALNPWKHPARSEQPFLADGICKQEKRYLYGSFACGLAVYALPCAAWILLGFVS